MLNPFSKIDDFAQRRIAEGVARHIGTAIATILVAKGYANDSQSGQIIEVLAGVGTLAYALYQSWQDKQHTEKVVEAASSLPPSASRKAIEQLATQTP